MSLSYTVFLYNLPFLDVGLHSFEANLLLINSWLRFRRLRHFYENYYTRRPTCMRTSLISACDQWIDDATCIHYNRNVDSSRSNVCSNLRLSMAKDLSFSAAKCTACHVCVAHDNLVFAIRCCYKDRLAKRNYHFRLCICTIKENCIIRLSHFSH